MSNSVYIQQQLEDSARIALIQGNHKLGFDILTKAIAQYPQFSSAYFLLSRLAYDFKNHQKEVELLTKAFELEPQNLLFLVYLARAYVLTGQHNQSAQLLEKAENFNSHTAETADLMANTYNRLCLYEKATRWFEQLIQLDQKNPAAYFNLASSQKFCGNFSGAKDSYEKAIAINPSYIKAHAALTSLGGITIDNNHIKRLEDLLLKTTNLDELLTVAHALSKEYEALNRFSDSFSVLTKAKGKKRTAINYQFSLHDHLFSELTNYYNQLDIKATNNEKVTNIFVVGMPRTGTTLVERILSNHQRVATGGELFQFSQAVKMQINDQSHHFILPEYLKKFSQIDLNVLGSVYRNNTSYLLHEKSILVDKLPLNALYAGLIMQALPSARVICLDRNPLDTITSNFRQLFSFHDHTFSYSLDLEDCTNYCIAFKKLMTLLQEKFPKQFLLINYENLVSHPDSAVEQLLDFCQLEWDADCTQIEKNSKPVATASAVQVRQPISPKGIGQWQNYALHLNAVKEKLIAAGYRL